MVNRSWWGKLALLVAFIVTSIVYVVPTVGNLNLETTKWPFKQKINLGLDLQGGLYLVLGVDFNRVYRDIMDRQATSLTSGLKDRGVPFTAVKTLRDSSPEGDPRLSVEFDGAKRDQVYNELKNNYASLRLVDEKPGRFELGLSKPYRDEIRERTVSQSIEVIRNRIDEFGVSEPSIASQGSDRIVVELPGVKEVERAKDLIGRTAKLEFKIADDTSMGPDQVAALIAEIEKTGGFTYKEGQKFSEYATRVNELAKGKIPEGTEIAFERAEGPPGSESVNRIPYLLKSKVDVTGDDLEDAIVGYDPESGAPIVNFSFNPRGASAFGELTGASIGKRLAIVLDNVVHSAPVINSRINDRGQITLGAGNYDDKMREAKDLAIVLRAGALPAQLDFLEQRIVGPSLGQDSIDKGVKAGIIGCIMVFLFMMVYYRGSGVVAAVSLLFNAFFMLAILIGMEATLTLPGIAGIALTIGMAVDSNVIIFERIRDELREGKSVAGAVEAGFQKAFSAIFDANITHGIVAFILMSFGTGPIRGFAVTLMVGIFTTLFCAVTVCKLFFDGYLGFSKREMNTLSI